MERKGIMFKLTELALYTLFQDTRKDIINDIDIRFLRFPAESEKECLF